MTRSQFKAMLASALGGLATNSDLRVQMGRAGRTRAAEFSISRMVAETLAIYEDVCRRG